MKTKHILLLILRLITGGLLLQAGITKLLNIEGTIGFFGAKLGLSPTIFWLVTIGEILAGLGIIFGVYTQIASVGAAIIMIGAIYYTGGAATSPILLLVGSLILVYMGSGKYAIRSCTFSCKDGVCSKETSSTPPTQTPLV